MQRTTPEYNHFLRPFQTTPRFLAQSSLSEPDSELAQKTRLKVKKPSRYVVVLHNDHYTTMEFVVLILKTVFAKTHESAVKIMYEIHHNGFGVAGVYSREIAETKVTTVHKLAEEQGHPLRASMEKE